MGARGSNVTPTAAALIFYRNIQGAFEKHGSKSSVAEEMLNDSKVKFVQNGEKLEEREKDFIMLRKDRKDNVVEIV